MTEAKKELTPEERQKIREAAQDFASTLVVDMLTGCIYMEQRRARFYKVWCYILAAVIAIMYLGMVTR